MVAAAPIRDDETLSGAAPCGVCHVAAYDDWRGSRHARAYDTLPADRRADARCVGCHTLGFGTLLRGVQCESCHGPATGHPPPSSLTSGRRRPPFMQVPDAVCLRCHTKDAPRPFDPVADRARVDHGAAAGSP